MQHATQTSRPKQQQPPEPEVLRLQYAHRESMWGLLLASLVVVVGLAFMVFGIPGGQQLVTTVLGGVAGKGIVVSLCRSLAGCATHEKD
jgi:putative copper export protein